MPLVRFQPPPANAKLPEDRIGRELTAAQERGEVATQAEHGKGVQASVRSADTQPATLPELGIPRQRASEYKAIAAAGPEFNPVACSDTSCHSVPHPIRGKPDVAELTTKTVVYRVFKSAAGDWGTSSLEVLCRDALEAKSPTGTAYKDDWLTRRFLVGGSVDHFRFTYALNYSEGALFGMLCIYSPSEHQAMIKQENPEHPETSGGSNEESLAQALNSVEISEKEPPPGEHFLKGHAYFLIRGNHVFVVQHVAVRTNSLEDYLHTLLKNSGVIPATNTFELRSLLSLSGDARELGEITSVEIGGVQAPTILEDEIMTELVSEVEHQQELGRVSPERSQGRRILDVLFGTMKADQIMAAVPIGADFEVDVRFGFRSRSKKISRAALSQIASAARDLPEGQVRAIGKDGKTRGNDLRLQTEMPFQRLRPNGTLLHLDHTRGQLLKVYARFVEDGKIVP